MSLHATEEKRIPLTLRLPVQGSIAFSPEGLAMPGHERLRAIIERRLPEAPFQRLIDLRLTDVGPGMCTWVMPASPWWQSVARVFPAGVAALIADTAGAAVLSIAPVGVIAPTSELAVDFLRPMSVRCGTIIARSRLVHVGRAVGLATVSVEDGRGRVLAHGTTRCVLAPLDAASIPQRLTEPTAGLEGASPLDTPLEGRLADPEFLGSVPGRELMIEVMKNSPFATLLGVELEEIDDGHVSVWMRSSPWLANPGGVVFGGFIALLADLAVSGAVISLLPPRTSYGHLDLKVSYVRPVTAGDGDLVAHASVAHRGRTIVITNWKVLNAAGKPVAIGNESTLLAPDRPFGRAVSIADELQMVESTG